MCMTGEAAVRAGAGLVEELLGKLDKLKRGSPAWAEREGHTPSLCFS